MNSNDGFLALAGLSITFVTFVLGIRERKTTVVQPTQDNSDSVERLQKQVQALIAQQEKSNALIMHQSNQIDELTRQIGDLRDLLKQHNIPLPPKEK